MSEITIRTARLDDASKLVSIYRYYVEKTAITFEYEVPTVAEFRRRMGTTMQKYPYLVIEEDGVIQGYAYAGAFNPREAYDWSSELTIYMSHTARKGGLGRRLYEALVDQLRSMGILNVYACIGYPQQEDAYLYEHHLDVGSVVHTTEMFLDSISVRP